MTGAVQRNDVLAADLPDGTSATDASWGLARGASLGAERRVVRRIAAGRKTEVYLAWDERRRSTVVAKLVRPDRVAAKLAKLRREAELLDRLAHPVLVQGYDAMLDASPPHLVLEYLEGPSLRQVMREGPVAPELVASIGLQVAGLLHYLAGEGLVHLDVKPHNVLFAPRTPAHLMAPRPNGARAPVGESVLSPAVKLIDVAGIQGVGEPTTGLGGVIPEHGDDETRVSAAAGVWLLGTTMWRALVGRSERERASGEDAGDSPGAAPGRFPAAVPEAMGEVVSACVRTDPSERPSAEEVAVALEPFAEDASGPRARPAGRRRRWLARAVGI